MIVKLAAYTQGGSTYSAKMAEWFGICDDAASRWATVGKHREKLLVATRSLPPVMSVIYELCSVPAEVIAEQVTPKTTQAEAREMNGHAQTERRRPPVCRG